MLTCEVPVEQRFLHPYGLTYAGFGLDEEDSVG